MEVLLQHGANPLHVFKDNSNCLIEAAKGGHTKIVELLIDWNYTLTQQQQQGGAQSSDSNNNCEQNGEVTEGKCCTTDGGEEISSEVLICFNEYELF